MEENILKEVYDCIGKCVEKKIYKSKIIKFLLGEKIQDEERDARYFSNILDGKVTPSKELLKIVAKSNNWTTKRLNDGLGCEEKVRRHIRKNLGTEISKIYNKYTSSSNEVPVDKMIQELVYKHFFGVTTVEGLFAIDKIIMSKNYVTWEEKEVEFYKQLSESSLIFVNGEPSNGKTQFLRNFFAAKIKELNYVNLVWVNCEEADTALEDCIVTIELMIDETINKVSMKELAKILRRTVHNTYLVIERPVLLKEDLVFLSQIASERHIKTVVETRTELSPKQYNVVNIGKWPEHKLKTIYENWVGDCSVDEKYYQQFFNEINYNPYIVELIAKNLKREKKKLEDSKMDFFELIDKKGHSGYIHANYRSKSDSSYPLKTLIQRVLEPYSDNEFIKEFVKLSLWTRCAVSKEVLIEIAGISELLIERALERSFLVWVSEEEKLVKMPLILVEALWEKEPIEYENYRKIIGDSFVSLQTRNLPNNFSYISMYETWENMVKRIHKEIATVFSEDRLGQKKRFDDWTQILETLKEYAESLGNVEMMDSINNILYTR